LIVRPANLDDVPVLMALEKDSPTAAHWPSARYEDAIRNFSPRRLVMVIEDESNILGFIVACAAETTDTHEWEIENIVVASAAWRRGLGARLLGGLLNAAPKGKNAVFFLEVRESNRAARALYEKFHFVEDGRRPRYYQQPQEDAILYRLALKSVGKGRIQTVHDSS